MSDTNYLNKTNLTSPLPPGSVLGVLGNGQLGRMFALAAARLGYRVWTFGPEQNSPAAQVAEREFAAYYDDYAALEEFARGIDRATLEFENIPVETVRAVSRIVPIHPGEKPLHIAQHRRREKEFLRENGFPCAPFRALDGVHDLRQAVDELGIPCVLKNAGFGYDGKGQYRIQELSQLDAAWSSTPAQERVLEGWISYEREISVMVARTADGRTTTWDALENAHRDGILDLTIYPARIKPDIAAAARDLALRIAERMEVIGLLCVEMFVERNGRLLVNETAPRPHNSGHLTIEASLTDQFQQQARITADLPLGSTAIRQPAAMVNLLGDVWAYGEPRWERALAMPGVAVHLYGKSDPRPGRKMGHITALGQTPDEAAELALAARRTLNPNL